MFKFNAITPGVNNSVFSGQKLEVWGKLSHFLCTAIFKCFLFLLPKGWILCVIWYIFTFSWIVYSPFWYKRSSFFFLSLSGK